MVSGCCELGKCIIAELTEFTQARRYQWGNQTMIDLQLGLRHALAGWPIDPQNLFALGYGAFGGWAVHWLQVRREYPLQSLMAYAPGP